MRRPGPRLALSLACLLALMSCGRTAPSTPSLGTAEQNCLEATAQRAGSAELYLRRTTRTVESTAIQIGVPGNGTTWTCVTTPSGMVQSITPSAG